jgi:hypothetical protein
MSQFPEKQDYTLLTGSNRGKIFTLNIPLENKLKDLSHSYFFGHDPEFGEAEIAVAHVLSVHDLLKELPQVAPDTVGAQWVMLLDDHPICVVPEVSAEHVLTEHLKVVYKCDPNDDSDPKSEIAGLALGLGIDFFIWLNKQAPAIQAETLKQAEEAAELAKRVAKYPVVPAEAKYFVGSDTEYPDRIHFDALSAFGANHEYVDIFDAQGEVLERYKYVDTTESPHEKPENFVGYTTEF